MMNSNVLYYRAACIAAVISAISIAILLISIPLLFVKIDFQKEVVAMRSEKFKSTSNKLWNNILSVHQELSRNARQTYGQQQTNYFGRSNNGANANQYGQRVDNSYSQNVPAHSYNQRTQLAFMPSYGSDTYGMCGGCVPLLCPSGPPGNTGPGGIDGKAGQPGYNGMPGEDGYDLQLGPEPDLPCVICPAGPTGIRGQQGERGRLGKPGSPGQKGLPGQIGEPGLTGDPGATGPSGPIGYNGPPGQRGDTVRNGIPVKGPKGPPGLRGPKGPPGINGKPGNIPGRPGIPGPASNVAGPPGDRGPQGPMGPWGPPGEPGHPATYCPSDCGVSEVLAPPHDFNINNEYGRYFPLKPQ